MLYQDASNPVFFFASGEYKTYRTSCRVPRDRAILVPLIQFTSAPEALPADDWFTGAPPEERTRQVQSSMRDLDLRVDGFRVRDPDAYSVGPLSFAHEFPKDTNYYSCSNPPFKIEGAVEPLYVVGYFVLFPPPSVGRHRLEYGGSLSYPNYDYVQRVNNTFIVE
jgi:hypothetical protein